MLVVLFFKDTNKYEKWVVIIEISRVFMLLVIVLNRVILFRYHHLKQ